MQRCRMVMWKSAFFNWWQAQVRAGWNLSWWNTVWGLSLVSTSSFLHNFTQDKVCTIVLHTKSCRLSRWHQLTRWAKCPLLVLWLKFEENQWWADSSTFMVKNTENTDMIFMLLKTNLNVWVRKPAQQHFRVWSDSGFLSFFLKPLTKQCTKIVFLPWGPYQFTGFCSATTPF